MQLGMTGTGRDNKSGVTCGGTHAEDEERPDHVLRRQLRVQCLLQDELEDGVQVRVHAPVHPRDVMHLSSQLKEHQFRCVRASQIPAEHADSPAPAGIPLHLRMVLT